MIPISVPQVVVIFFLLLLGQEAPPVQSGSRLILGGYTKDKPEEDHALSLNATVFDAVLDNTSTSYAIVEFFAHWCPACRIYKSHYEKVARLFNGPDAVHPGIMLMTSVDCAQKLNSELCNKFSVAHFPMLFWGPPSEFVHGSWNPKEVKSKIHLIDDGRTADRLLDWINKHLGSSYSLVDEKLENENLHSNISDPGEISHAFYDIEEATTISFEIILEHKMIKSETRAPLIKFLQLLVAHHPSKRCRMGSAELLVNFDDWYPPGIQFFEDTVGNNKNELRNFQICGKEVPKGYWLFCRGSKNDTRGFSCGLWVLLHSLSVRIENEESQFTFKTICGFVHHFFICQECRQHFHDMCSRVNAPFSASRDFVLWLWDAHNRVNERLMKEEASLGTGDPKFPTIIWPPKQLCPTCYRSRLPSHRQSHEIGDWNADELHKLLTNYYGKTLVSVYQDKSAPQAQGRKKMEQDAEELIAATNASSLMVPVGAAFAIAVASCAFGALACYWRSCQKNRRSYLQLHLSKKT